MTTPEELAKKMGWDTEKKPETTVVVETEVPASPKKKTKKE